jgi:hypothetical protein
MTALVVIETAALALLAVLVAGLLRSHATILRRLHALDGGADAANGSAVTPLEMPHTRPARINTMPGIPNPEQLSGSDADADRRPASDIVGTTPDGGTAVVRTVDVPQDTVIAFLSSGCTTCQEFWEEFAQPRAVRLPRDTRLIVVTKGPEEESPAEVDRLRPPGTEVIMSSAAWADHAVPGSPYVIAVDGPSGRVKGEGTGMSWAQVARLLAQATGDLAYLSDTDLRKQKPSSDAEREARADRELMAAGILPGDPSLYPAMEPPGEQQRAHDE